MTHITDPGMKTRQRRAKMLTGISLLAIIPFLILCTFVYPVNDDFTFGLRHIQKNVFQVSSDIYLYWSGRYFATLISALNPFAVSDNPIPLFRIYSAVAIVLTTFVMTLSPAICCRRQLTHCQSAGLGGVFLLTYLALMPSVSQAFYWFSSCTAFTIPSLLYIMLVALTAADSKASYFIACTLALIVPGGNEVTAVITVGTLGYIAFTYHDRKYWLLLTLSAVALLLVALAPGNASRMANQHIWANAGLWALTFSIGQTVSWIFLWGPVLLLATTIYIPLFGRKLASSPIYDVSFSRYLVWFFITIILAHIPPTYGISSAIVDRTANCLLIFVIIGYFHGVNILLRKHRATADRLASLLSGKWIFGASLFCFLFAAPFSIDSPVATAVTDIITGKAADYKRIQQQRVDIVRQTPSAEPVKLPPLGITSKSLFVKELESEPDTEFTSAFSRIYKSRVRVYVEDREARFEDNLTALKNYAKKGRVRR